MEKWKQMDRTELITSLYKMVAAKGNKESPPVAVGLERHH